MQSVNTGSVTQETSDSAPMNRAEFWENFNVVFIYHLTEAQYIKSFCPVQAHSLLHSTEFQRT